MTELIATVIGFGLAFWIGKKLDPPMTKFEPLPPLPPLDLNIDSLTAEDSETFEPSLNGRK